MNFIEKIRLFDKEWTLIKERRYQKVWIYQSEDAVLRIGEAMEINGEIELASNLLGIGFPIPNILTQGTYESYRYFIEEKVGEQPLAMDIIQNGGVASPQIEESLYVIVNRFAAAQLKTQTTEDLFNEFLEKSHYNSVANDEVNEITRKKMLEASEVIAQALKNYPFVLSHGDFNTWNIFDKHVIDFEHKMYAPFGYDLVTMIFHDYFFPDTDGYELKRTVRFSKEFQKTIMDRVFELVRDNFNLEFAEYLPAIILPKLVWSSALMDHRPKLQRWRFDMLEGVLDRYLAGEDFVNLIIDFPS